MSEATPAAEAPTSSNPDPTPSLVEPSVLGVSPSGEAQDRSPGQEVEAKPGAPATPGEKLYAKEGEAPAEGEPPEGEEKPEGEGAAAPKPEDYADLALPEGFEKDEASFTQFGELAAKAGVPKEIAQDILTLGATMVQTALEKQTADQAALWTETVDGWKTELSTREPFSPANRKASQLMIGRALDEYGSAGAREAFDLTGAGHNPDIVEFVYNMAKHLVEGGVKTPKGPVGPKSNTLGGSLYPDQTN